MAPLIRFFGSTGLTISSTTASRIFQAEMAQGTLTTIFEFQTMVCQLTGMDVANASMYDGSTAVPEAAMMAMRITNRHKVLIARAVHPEYRTVLATYAKYQGTPVAEIAYDTETGQLDFGDLEAKLDDRTAAVIVQSPNFFGSIEDWRKAAGIAHGKGAFFNYNFFRHIYELVGNAVCVEAHQYLF